jgi:hypothetical protein
MKQTITIYKKIMAWEKELHIVDADTKEDALVIARNLANDPDSLYKDSFRLRDILEDSKRYEMDASDWNDISYEIAIDGEMMEGGKRFGGEDFDKRMNRPQL